MSSRSAARRTAEPALVRSGAAIYFGAGVIGTIQAAVPGGTPFSLAPAPSRRAARTSSPARDRVATSV